MKIRRKTSSTIPFGWKQHEVEDHLLLENSEEQETLEYIRKLKDNYSLRTLAKVIKAKHGRTIHPNGMQKIINRKY